MEITHVIKYHQQHSIMTELDGKQFSYDTTRDSKENGTFVVTINGKNYYYYMMNPTTKIPDKYKEIYKFLLNEFDKINWEEVEQSVI